MTNAAPPPKPPFPFLGTLSVEGTRLETEEGVPSGRLLTLPLECILHVRRVIDGYITRYSPGHADSGAALLLHGPHGVGKTHTLRYAMEHLATAVKAGPDGTPARVSLPKPLQLYVKAEDGDFLALYRRAMSQVPLESLREIVVASFAVATGEQVGSDSRDVVLAESAVETLRQRPQIAGRLLGDVVVEAGAVQERWERDIETITSGRSDFGSALSALTHPDFAQTAYQWLIARDVDVNGSDTSENTARLGLSHRLTSGEDARTGFALLSALCRRAGYPFALYVDQYEKLIFNQDGTVIKSNVGLLHSVVEVVPRECGLLALAGNEEAFSALPVDLVQRFGSSNVIDFPNLTPKHAKALLALYMHQDKSYPEFSVSDGDLEPFTPEAVDELHFYSDGKPRRLLQMAAELYSAASQAQNGGTISVELVRATLKQYSHVYFDQDSVMKEIDRIVQLHGLSFERSFKLGDVRVGGAALAANGSPALLVEVREARYFDDEARNALTTLLQVIRLRAEQESVPFVFIALGYTSGEVAQLIGRFAQLVTYNPDTFGQRFEEVLNSRPPVTTPTPTAPPQLEQELAELRAQLTTLVTARDSEAKNVEARLGEFLVQQSEARRTERLETARPAWLVERSRIEDETRRARAERRQRNLAELERLRDRAESDWRGRTRLRLAVLAVFVLAALLVGAYLTNLVVFPAGVNAYALFLFLTILAAAGLGWLLLDLLNLGVAAGGPSARFALGECFGWRARPVRELGEQVNSSEELDRLAQAVADDAPAGHLLGHVNPHFRYAGAVRLLPGSSAIERIRTALLVERSAIVRRALATRLGSYLSQVGVDPDRAGEPLSTLMEASIPEVIYALEAAGRRAVLPQMRPSRPVLALIALLDVDKAKLWSNRRSNLLIELFLEVDTGGGPLADAFNSGLDRTHSPELAGISPERIRATIADLSPVEEGGLGTFDGLRLLPEIDRYYLFFRQLEFFVERDLLPRAEAATA